MKTLYLTLTILFIGCSDPSNNMKPWDDEALNSNVENIVPSYKKCKANEFYFAFSYSYGVVLTITPAEYFDRKGIPFDDEEIQIEHLLPKHLVAVSETDFSFKGTPRKTRNEMLALGFRENKDFSKKCLQSNKELAGKNILDLKPYNQDDYYKKLKSESKGGDLPRQVNE